MSEKHTDQNSGHKDMGYKEQHHVHNSSQNIDEKQNTHSHEAVTHAEHMEHGVSDMHHQEGEKNARAHEHAGHGEMSEMQHNNHEDHSGHAGHVALYKKKFIVSLLLGIPILVISPMMGHRFFFTITFPGSEWVVALLSTVLFLYGGTPFLQGAVEELKSKKPAMMTLISMGISVAYLYSMYAFVSSTLLKRDVHVMDFFWELASLIMIMLLGHWLEMRAVSGAGDALQALVQLLPSEALLVDERNGTHRVPLQHVQLGNTLQVLPGEKMPTDGVVLSGKSYVNESMVTGESREIQKAVGDTVIGGSINGAGTIQIRVTGTGETGYLSQVMHLVTTAQNDKSKSELLSDKVAGWLFYFAVIVGLIALIVWVALGQGLEFAIERLVTTLVIACPHALGLAVPLVTARSTSIAAQNGLLVQNRQALEVAPKIDVLLMDKTGTLTEGEFKVNSLQVLVPQYTTEQLLGLMAGLEQGSSHPLAAGILAKADEQNVRPAAVQNIQNLAGVGITGVLGGKDYRLVSAVYLDEQGIEYNQNIFKQLAGEGNSVSYLLEGESPIGLVGQGDRIRPESQQLIGTLQKLGIEPVMLTGDNEEIARKVANELGIVKIFAKARPEDKARIVAELQQQGKTVMMVGDGVNDAPSLARANVGVAIGAGTDVAIEAADVILVKSNPLDILRFLQLARSTSRKMLQNLWWGAGYNVVAVPLAAGVLAYWGILLSPAVGAVLMSLSTIIVAVNALSLRIQE